MARRAEERLHLLSAQELFVVRGRRDDRGSKEHAETSMLALHLLQSALVHVNTPLVQQVLAEPAWASRLSEEDRRGLTALFWSNVNPYGTFHLDMNKYLDPGPATAVPRPRTPADTAADHGRRHDEGLPGTSSVGDGHARGAEFGLGEHGHPG
ncbi:Tn3 family transposase [Streptomyces sp. NRRL S-495]|uniref:Tn3 family transposase n=1 Tax=Streptomyces sp. NRRL S-495 TaxID=1609133 RepID=UPI0019009B6E|nr:Tn3 family transposase [Streptomyces sp. NRRL S-495]